jgi:hypothetical protein
MRLEALVVLAALAVLILMTGGRTESFDRCGSQCSDPRDRWSCCECKATGTYFPPPMGDPGSWDYDRRFELCMGSLGTVPL